MARAGHYTERYGAGGVRMKGPIRTGANAGWRIVQDDQKKQGPMAE